MSFHPHGKNPSIVWVASFTLLYTLAATIFAYKGSNREFLGYIVVMVVLVCLVWKVHSSVTLSSGALWCLSLWGCSHMAGGLLYVPEAWPVAAEPRVLYNLWLIPGWLKYDHLVHVYGFGITTWVCWQGLRRALLRRNVDARPTGGLLLLAVAAGMGFGALNEVIEFFATLIVAENNVGGYINTCLDLVSNLAGCIAAALLIYRFEGRGPEHYRQ